MISLHNEFATKERRVAEKESCVIALQIKKLRTAKYARVKTEKRAGTELSTFYDTEETISHFQEVLKEKLIPPLRVAEIRSA